MKKNYFLFFPARLHLILLLAGGLFSCSTISFSQNIAINATGNPANISAGLDVDFTNKGFLIPRVSLTIVTDGATIANPATSLIVYNTNAAMTAGSGVGFYFNAGTPGAPNWVRILNGGATATDWLLTGNVGTTAGTNFLGTTDAQDVVIKANNAEGFRVYSGGIMASLGVGATVVPSTTSAQASFVLRSSTSNFQINAQDGGGRTSFLWNASGTGGNYLVSAEPAARMTESINGVVGGTFGFYGAPSGTAGNPITWTQTGYLSSADQIWLSPRGTSSDFFISTLGNVGVGTTTPLNLLHVVGNNDNNGNYYSQIRIDGTGAYPLDIAGISLNPNTAGVQSHIRFLENGTPKVQIRFNNGNVADNKLKIYSWTTGTDFVTFDATTGYVGIGTTTPGQKLTVSPNSAMGFTLGGLPNPVLSVGAYGASPSDGIGLFAHDLTSGYVGWVGAIRVGNEAGGWGAKTLRLQVPDGSGNVLNALNILGGSGNVGIGPTAPAYKLDVSGTINSSLGGYGNNGCIRMGSHTISSHPNSWIYIGDQNGNVYGGTGIAMGNCYVASTFYYPNGTQGAGKVLVSDASGIASWQTTSNLMQVYTVSASQTSIGGFSYVQVTGLSQTIVTTRSSYFIINTTGSLESQGGPGSWTGTKTCLANNGTCLTEQGNDIINPTSPSVFGVITHWGINYTQLLPAGTYTFTVSCKIYNGTAGFYAGGATTSGLPNDGTMTIQVIPQ